MRRLVARAVLVSWVIARCFAQQPLGEISGQVTDMAGAPILAMVELISYETGKPFLTEQTDAQGRYRISNLSLGTEFQLRVSFSGFRTHLEERVSLTDFRPSAIRDVVLQHRPAIDLSRPIPPSAAITGIVTDPSGAGIPAPTIEIVHDSEPTRKLVGGPQGQFRLDQLSTGTYEVTASYPGFKDQTFTIVISERFEIHQIKLVLESLFPPQIDFFAHRSQRQLHANSTPASVKGIPSPRHSRSVAVQPVVHQTTEFNQRKGCSYEPNA